MNRQGDLREWIKAQAVLPLDVGDDAIRGIDRAIEQFSNAEASKTEVRHQAEGIAEAARAYREKLERLGSCWPWILSGRHGPPPLERVLSETRGIEESALALAARLPRGKGPDEPRRGLAFQLAGYFRIITGEEPTFSNSGDLKSNHPGTKFAHFVHVALTGSSSSSDIRVKQLLISLPSFIRDAVEQRKDRESPFFVDSSGGKCSPAAR
jgi:hypothetical protein